MEEVWKQTEKKNLSTLENECQMPKKGLADQFQIPGMYTMGSGQAMWPMVKVSYFVYSVVINHSKVLTMTALVFCTKETFTLTFNMAMVKNLTLMERLMKENLSRESKMAMERFAGPLVTFTKVSLQKIEQKEKVSSNSIF